MVMTKTEALKILELRQGSTPEEIRSSYKKLALKWHPDKHNNSTESTKKFQEISEAYKRLTSKEDDDDITISMADMFDLFAHIFFSNSGYFVNDHLFYSDDDDDDDDDDVDDHNNGYIYLNVSDSSDDDVRLYRSRQHHAKYSDLMASRVSKAAANAYRNEMRKKKAQVRPGISEEQARKNADELIKEEEKLKKKAEKRRARKKRNRANRKQREKERKTDDPEAENNDESQEEENEERRDSSKENKNSTNTEQGSRSKANNKSSVEKEDEDSENEHTHVHDETWDTSSAFFNHAARRGPTHTTNHNTNNETTSAASAEVSVNRNEYTTQNTREHSHRPEEAEEDRVIAESRRIAAIGNGEANAGNYADAIEYFTRAISIYDRDFRFFGNRSYCYDRLGEYSKALQDAEITIMLIPHWAKGYFRKGRALAGLKQYSDAEKAFLQVLKLDKRCEDAKFELTRVRVQQLKDMGFGHAQSERAVRLYGTVHAALDALLSGKVKNLVANEDETYVSDGDVDDHDNDPRQRYSDPMVSLWVGNIDSKQVTERQLTHLFSKFGTVTLIRILPQSFCAFVNYENKESAARAMQSLQGHMLGGQNIRIRYQSSEKNTKNTDKTAKPTGPVNGNECYFWRTTGCVYGDKCHYSHIPGHRGVDIEKVEQKYGKIKKKAR